MKRRADDIHEIQPMIPDINELEPALLEAKRTGYTDVIDTDLYSCLEQRYTRWLQAKYGLDEAEAREAISQTHRDVMKNYDDDKARRYGPLSRYVSIAIRSDAKDVLRRKKHFSPEVSILNDTGSPDRIVASLDSVKNQATADIAESMAYADVLRRYMAGRIDFAAEIILLNMRLLGYHSIVAYRHLQRDERMTAYQLPSMRVCLTNETLLFVAELCGIDWAVNKPRLERAIDEGFVRHVMVDPPAHPMALKDIPRVRLREEHRKLPVASKVCAAYLNISDSTYCDHHQKYHHVVWKKSRKDLDEQLNG